MEKKDEELIASLLDREPELRRYYEEHLDLERQLAGFQQKLYLTPEEEVERKRLQKRKLAGKDKIMDILARHRGH
jgi:uncharacterized protein YdcH (DUF465 family)